MKLPMRGYHSTRVKPCAVPASMAWKGNLWVRIVGAEKKTSAPVFMETNRHHNSTIPQFQSHTVPIIVGEFEMAPISKVGHRLLKGILIERYTMQARSLRVLLAIAKSLFSGTFIGLAWKSADAKRMMSTSITWSLALTAFRR